MIKYLHWIVEDKFTGERKEVIKRGQLADTPRYKVIGCCGFHEVKKGENKK